MKIASNYVTISFMFKPIKSGVNLSELEEKVANILEKYELLKKDKEKIEARLASKNKENEDVKKHLGKVLEERNVIKRKLDGLIEKIDSLEAKA